MPCLRGYVTCTERRCMRYDPAVRSGMYQATARHSALPSLDIRVRAAVGWGSAARVSEASLRWATKEAEAFDP